MYGCFFASAGIGSLFAFGDWTIGFPNQLLLCSMSNSSSVSGTAAFRSSWCTSSLELLMPGILLISFLEHMGFSASPLCLSVFYQFPKECLQGFFHSWLLLVEVCSSVFSRFEHRTWIEEFPSGVPVWTQLQVPTRYPPCILRAVDWERFGDREDPDTVLLKG